MSLQPQPTTQAARGHLLVLLVYLALSPALATGESLTLDARTLFEKSTTRDVQLSPQGNAIRLARGELFEDDGPAAGYSYRPNEDRLSATTWIRKDLVIPRPGADTATLLVGPGGDLQCQINGKPVFLGAPRKVGGYWQAYTIPADSLRQGSNAIVFHGKGKVWIARSDEAAAGSTGQPASPRRSARSTDAGKTWERDHLGTGGKTSGEYYVRLFLDHYRSHGHLILPVVDLGNLSAKPIAPPVVSLGPARIRVKGKAGDTGKLTVQTRSGTHPDPHAPGWSGWQNLPSDGSLPARTVGRYLQVKVGLRSEDPLRTPGLQELVIEASPRLGKTWTQDLKVVEAHNEEIVRSSIPFAYEPFDHPVLAQLRRKYQLDEVVKDAKGELDLIGKLAAWSSRQWQKGHLKEGYPLWNALDILATHRDGTPVGGFCQQYNLVFLQACESFGIPGRAISIGPGDHGSKIRGGHEVVELWSNDYRKWIHVDGNMAWYFRDQTSRVPLSLWELRKRQIRKLQNRDADPVELVKLAEPQREWQDLASWPPFLELRLIPRGNFLEKPAPLPLNQGMRGWFWTGHYVADDPDFPASLLYSHRVTRQKTWEWTLNQARFTLEATEEPGTVRVHLETVTPGLKTYLASLDGQGEHPVPASFLWKLHPGKNTLEARPLNNGGRKGIASRVVLLRP